jgi:hypothetical protein
MNNLNNYQFPYGINGVNVNYPYQINNNIVNNNNLTDEKKKINNQRGFVED